MITIDHLNLHLTGLPPADAKGVGMRLAERLSEASLEPSRDLHIGLLQRRIEARPGESPKDLADRIADELLRSLERSV